MDVFAISEVVVARRQDMWVHVGWPGKGEVSSMMAPACEDSGVVKVKELAVAGAPVGMSGPTLASPSSLKIWLAARTFRGMLCVVLRPDGRRDGGGAGTGGTSWIGRAASKFCRASATTFERDSAPIQ